MLPEEAIAQIKGLVESVGEIQADVDALHVLQESVRQLRALETTRDLFSVDWKPIEKAKKNGTSYELVTVGGIVCTGRFRYGERGEPQQDVADWRADCCGRFGGFTHFRPRVKPPRKDLESNKHLAE